MSLLIDPEVDAKIERLEHPFNAYGYDRFGVSKQRLKVFYSFLALLYRRYFRVTTTGIENVPDRGRAMVIGNHSGGLPVDGAMVLASLVLEHDPPRIGHGMVEKFAAQWPFVSTWFARTGQLTGLPEHAVRLLEDDRVLMVFPEGARGTGKLYKDRYKMVKFGTGFMRLALQTKTPIVPFAFVGGEEALPTVYHANTLAKLVGAPYWPVPPYLVPVPLPRACSIHYGEPLRFDGTGNESDEVIEGYVDRVKGRVTTLIEKGLQLRGERHPALAPAKL